MSTLEQLIKTREEKIKELKKRGINPYPAKIGVKGDLIKISQAKKSLDKIVLVAGRLWSLREHGAMVFADLKDSEEKIQLLFNQKNLAVNSDVQAGPSLGWGEIELLDRGDFLAVSGKVFKTKAGEITVEVTELQLLSKSLRPLPTEWYGLKDVEERYRKRYLDLLLNPGVRERFNLRTKIVSALREYLDGLGFWEAETPTLQPLYGGANAKPFKTHLNALHQDVYLRIADELYLKRLIVGGYEKVYEICKDFRNEGIDQTHFPEFTMVEYYQSYADYHQVMDVTEGLFKHIAKKVLNSTVIQVEDKSIDIGKKWQRITMLEAIKQVLGFNAAEHPPEFLKKYCRENKIELIDGETKGQLIFLIFEHLVAGKLIEPTWVLDYPKDVSPLAKQKSEDSDWVERFEGYIGGKEICDGWSELTDPREQRQRFETDVKTVRKDKEEAQQVDEDFLEAMEYGMPPLGGIGIGIDRLTMFFTNTWAIKETILFPTLKSKE
ncbi:MAG: lysine--tRNA ligase [Patescibacteria group bacterium]